MKGRMLCGFVILLLQILSWVCVISRPFAPNHQPALFPQQGPAQSPQSVQFTQSSKQGDKLEEGEMMNEEARYGGEQNKIGSSPPSCEHKCYGCSPCEATQVPTATSVHAHLGIQYTNYEPEGWKCKCGPTLYSP